MALFEQFANLAQTTLILPAASGATTLNVNSSSKFPASGQFRIVVDSELFLVTNVAGNVFTVQPGFEGSTQSAHLAGATVALVMTAGVISQLYNHNLGVYNYYEYAPQNIGSTQDVTTSLQNFLLNCQLIALTLKTSALDDQAQRVFVTAYLPRGDYYITCPLIVPELVNLKCDGLIIRNGSSGTITGNYTGDTTSKALANLYQPAVIIVPRAHCTMLNLYSNNDGVHLGAGLFSGRNWMVSSVSIGSAGTGYHVGDVLTCAQPSKAPYVAATVTVNAVNGNGGVTSATIANTGAYALPPSLQLQQWTTANNFSVFDNSGNFLTSGGNGTGATIKLNWQPDWMTGNTNYLGGAGGVIADTILSHIRIMHVDTTTSTTYGPMNAITLFGLNFSIDDIEIQGGQNGFNFNFVSDVRGSRLNCVGSSNGLVIFGGANIVATDVVIDTPHFWALAIDNTQGISLSGRIFNRNLVNYSGANNYTIAIGLNSSTSPGQDVEGVVLDFELTNAGSGSTTSVVPGNPALYLAYLKGSRIDLTITNFSTATTLLPITSYAAFGPYVDSSNILRGSIDNITGALFSGTIPGCGIDVWDANAGGYAKPAGTYQLYGNGAPANGTSGTGAGKTPTGSFYLDTTNAVQYLNKGTATSPAWHAILTA